MIHNFIMHIVSVFIVSMYCTYIIHTYKNKPKWIKNDILELWEDFVFRNFIPSCFLASICIILGIQYDVILICLEYILYYSL